MMARNKSGIERFFTKSTKEIMQHNYVSKQQAQELTQEWGDDQLGIQGKTTKPRAYSFETSRCLGEYIGYTGRTMQL